MPPHRATVVVSSSPQQLLHTTPVTRQGPCSTSSPRPASPAMASSSATGGAVLVLLVLLSLLPLISAQAGLTFSLQTLNAPWSARSTMQVELMRFPFTAYTPSGQQIAVPANSLVLQGSASYVNDVWASTNRGVSWQLIAGVVNSTTRAFAPYDVSSFTPATYGGFTVDANSTIYRISGRLASGDCTASVWTSTDGKQWRDQVTASSAVYSPLRDETTAVTNSRGHLFLFGGRECNTAKTALNDAWRSTDQGRNWQLMSRAAPWSARVGPFSLNMKLRVTGIDVLLFFTGVGGGSDTNDVWASSDDGATWLLLTGQAQFPSRNNVNAEITEDGLIVMTAGKHDHPDGRREYLNDVWVSADGGYNWGRCVEDAPYGDRRFPATVLDELGRLLVMGGYDTSRSYNDVWRSSQSFLSWSAVSAACGVRIPQCGPGLSCLPTDPTFTRLSDGSVYCNALRLCANAPKVEFVLQTLNAPFTARAASQTELYPKTLSYTSVRTNSVVRIPANALVMQGSLSLSNDVWASSDHGRTWDLIAGVTKEGVRAASPYDQSSFQAADFGGFAITADSSFYRIGGRLGGSACSNAVWGTSDGGKTWKNAVVAGSSTFSPLRDETIGLADSAGNLYIMAGRLCGNTSVRLNDVWRSTDKGRNWSLQSAAAPWSARVNPFVLAMKSRTLGKDVLVLIGGIWSQPPRDLNDLWVSSDQGATWVLMTDRASFPSRNNANAEVTKSGLMILTAGKHDRPDGFREYLNDVWVSADGGYTWGQCTQEAAWEDRRVPSTVLDETGRLVLLGGYDDAGVYYRDVWRTTMSFNDYTAISAVCGISIPACGPGLTCMPTDPGFQRMADGSVTCNALRACASSPAPPTSILFNLQCSQAPWSARSTMQTELLGRATSYRNQQTGQTVSVPANSLIMQGNQNYRENDVWLTSDRGVSWQLIAGVSMNGASGMVAAAAPYDASSFTPDASFGGYTVDSQYAMYRIGGAIGSGVCTEAVFRSTDGKTWTNQINPRSRLFSPLRDETVAVADSIGRLYLMAGRRCPDKASLNDVWTSSDQGQNWQLQTGAASWSKRIAPFVLHVKSATLGSDTLLLFGGVDSTGDRNDVWATTTLGKTWVRMTDQAPWPSRNNANAEVTKAGLIVVTAGKHDRPDGFREYLNDVWVSADGGWTWGLCAEDAAYADRRVPSTVLDQDGYLLVLGGFDSTGQSYNDVWRSAVSFNNLRTIGQVCGIQVNPTCGLGLHCLPGMAGFQRRVLTAAPTCTALAVCSGEAPGEESSSTAGKAKEEEGKGASVWIIAAALVVLALLAAAWYYVHSRAKRTQQMKADAAATVGTDGGLGEQLLETAEGKTYSSTEMIAGNGPSV